MQHIKRFLWSLLALFLSLCFAGCTETATPTTVATTIPEETKYAFPLELTPEEEAVLQQRRDIAESYVRESLTLLWRSSEPLVYGLAERDNGTVLYLAPGNLYKGLPYAYGCGTKTAFLEYAGEPDEHGVYTISGLSATALDYGTYGARVGNDCSSVVTNAWSLIGTSFTTCMSSTMFEDFGAIPVGEYDFCVPISPETGRITDTSIVATQNGKQTMFAAYAQLQKADAVFRQSSGGSNHTMMIVDVHVEYADGLIDGDKSYVTVLEQTRSNFTKGVTEIHPELNELVYVIGGVDKVYKFNSLFNSAYLPVTIKELRDPSPVEDPWVKDSETDLNIDKLFVGIISSNMFIDTVEISILDENGQMVQSVAGRARRRYNKEFELERFMTELPGSMKGSIDLETLKSGNYRCTLTARLTSGQEFIVRDFTFSK